MDTFFYFYVLKLIITEKNVFMIFSEFE